MKTIFLFPILCMACTFPGYGQFLDSFRISIGTVGTFAQEDYQPHWLVSNRFGAISEQQQYDASTYAGFSNTHLFRKKKATDSAGGTYPAGPYIKYGIRAFNNNHFQDFTVQEGYLKAGFNNWELRFGRIMEVPGEVDQDLSSGSLGLGNNALPIPKIGIVLTRYSNIPFTNGWVQVKGQLSHGWFGNNRYMKEAFYHEKALYLRFGKERFKFFMGMQHFGEWAGRRGEIKLERSWKGFWDVFFAKTANDGSVDPSFDPNRAGDQRGIFEFGFDYDFNNASLHFYNQTPFESGNGINIKNIDRLAGLSITSKNKNSILKKVLLEFIYTRQMEDYAPPATRQTYYNNGYYRTGWEYENRVIGSPLFINRSTGQHYFDNIKPFGWDTDTTMGNVNIIFMRMTGGNIGGMYSISKKLSAKTIVTYVNGLYRRENKGQLYALHEMTYKITNNLTATGAIAVDAGDLTKNNGLLLGIHWEFRK